MSRYPESLWSHVKRTVADPARKPPSDTRCNVGEEFFDPRWTASCPFCRQPLWYGMPNFGRVARDIQLRCTPMRSVRCPIAALLAVRCGPAEGLNSGA